MDVEADSEEQALAMARHVLEEEASEDVVLLTLEVA